MARTSPCPSCDEFYESLGQHFRRSGCEAPALPDYTKSIIEGLLLGDGHVTEGGIFSLSMRNKTFLKFLYHHLDPFVTCLNEYDDGFYNIRTHVHPDVLKLREKYYTPEKNFTKTSLNPLMMKMWYVADGGLSYSSSSNRAMARIRCDGQLNNSDIVKHMIDSTQTGANLDIYSNRMRVRWNVKETEDLLDWMGEPVPGFEYKWVNNNRCQYDELKRKV